MNARPTTFSFQTAALLLAISCACSAMIGCERPYKPANYRPAPRAEANEAGSETKKRTANVRLPRVTDWTSPAEIGRLGSGFSPGPYRGGGYRGYGYQGSGYRGYAFGPYRGNAYAAAAYRGFAYRGFAYRGFENNRGQDRGIYPPATTYRGYGKPTVKPYRGYQTSETVYGIPQNNSGYRGYQNPSTGGAYRGYRNPVRN